MRNKYKLIFLRKKNTNDIFKKSNHMMRALHKIHIYKKKIKYMCVNIRSLKLALYN